MKHAKLIAGLFSAAVILAILWPVTENWQESPKDEFPLSYYPMFSHKRKATYAFYYLIGRDSAGRRHTIPYRYCGTGGFNQVRRQVRKKGKNGHANELTLQVAERLRRCKTAPWNTLTQVALVKGRYHLEDYFVSDQKLPLSEKVYSQQTIESNEKPDQ